MLSDVRWPLAWLMVMYLAAACGPSSPAGPASQVREQAVPTEFRAACGEPGQTVKLRQPTATILRETCDLTGVVLVSATNGGAVVPPPGETVQHGDGLVIESDTFGNVTYRLSD